MADQITSATASAKSVRMPARKVRMVIDLIRGKSVANAEHNYDLDAENLVVTKAYANEGPTLKRFRPRAKGSASPINKRTSRITVVVSEKEA